MIAGIETGFRPADPEAARRGTAARIPLGRLGSVEDVANLMLVLLSPESGFTAGGAYTIDGGIMAGRPG